MVVSYVCFVNVEVNHPLNTEVVKNNFWFFIRKKQLCYGVIKHVSDENPYIMSFFVIFPAGVGGNVLFRGSINNNHKTQNVK